MTNDRYDPGWYELLPGLSRRDVPWDRADVLAELAARASAQKSARELRIDYYRIGYRLAFPLPLSTYPSWFPGGIDGVPDYPWMLWLAWELDERWRTLEAAWRYQDDSEALALLVIDLQALAGWERYSDDDQHIMLVTATLAGCLARLMTSDHLRKRVLPAAESLLEMSVLPWFEQVWRSPCRPLSTKQVQNRPLIALVRAAQLTSALQHDAAPVAHARAVEAVDVWWSYRNGGQWHTEAAAYDGYLLYHITEWIDTTHERTSLIAAGAYGEIVRDWMHLTLPGRPDLVAPLSDVEPQMPFWTTASIRVAGWHADAEAAEFIRRYPLQRLSAGGLVAALDFAVPAAEPADAGLRRQPAAVSVRSGWTHDDVLIAVSASRGSMDHIQHDGGHVVLGWRGRFWITDPGYQQYRTDLEREYTLGPSAHNCPVIDGQPQTERAAGVVTAEGQHVQLDLTRCYPNLANGTSVRRDVWLDGGGPQGTHVVRVRDTFTGLRAGASVAYHWLGGTDQAWAFVDGWARLSCASGALWIGMRDGDVAPEQLVRHPGTRGPLTLQVADHLTSGAGERRWVFVTDPDAGWQPPDLGDRLEPRASSRS